MTANRKNTNRKTVAQFVPQPTELWAGRTESGKEGVAVLRVLGWVTTNDEYGFSIEPVVSDHNLNGLLRPLSVTVNHQVEYSDDPDYWNKRERPYTVVTPGEEDSYLAKLACMCPRCESEKTGLEGDH